MTIRWKLGVIGVIALAAVILVGALGGYETRTRMIEAKHAQLVGTVDMAIDLAGHLEADVVAVKITREDAIQSFRQTLHAMRYDNGNGYIFAYTLDGVMFANVGAPQDVGKDFLSDTDPAGTPYVRNMMEIAKTKGEGFTTYERHKPGQEQILPKLAYVKKFAPWSLVLGNGAYYDDVDDAIRSMMLKMGGLMAVIAILTVGGCMMVSKSITRPLDCIREKMERLATGDTSIDLPETGRKDEVGEMAVAVQVFKQSMIDADRMRREQEEIKRKAEQDRHDELNSMANRFESSVGVVATAVSSAASDMQTSAERMADVARNASSKAATVAAAAQQASRNVETVAAASTELAAASGEIARQMTKSQDVAVKATEEAETTNQLVLSLAESVSKIGAVVELINDIAAQTNLLALNATIEAARAGDAGKGFAVVANEVKTLANQTAKATGEITEQISAVQQKTGQAVTAIEAITKVIVELERISSSIASAVQEQTAATAEIARNIEEAALGTANVSSNIADVEYATEESGKAADGIRAYSDTLSHHSKALNGDVSTFLKQVRTA
jgi:methyl-accepting chemotaxis protein